MQLSEKPTADILIYSIRLTSTSLSAADGDPRNTVGDSHRALKLVGDDLDQIPECLHLLFHCAAEPGASEAYGAAHVHGQLRLPGEQPCQARGKLQGGLDAEQRRRDGLSGVELLESKVSAVLTMQLVNSGTSSKEEESWARKGELTSGSAYTNEPIDGGVPTSSAVAVVRKMMTDFACTVRWT